MKKTLLLATLLAAGFGANAQITDGSNAPQIVGNRIVSIEGEQVTYGEEISLQAYLDAGKTVVVDMSAAWCAPCWGFHNSHTLEDFYAAYGPDGSDELRIMFVEADPSTNVRELGGQSLPPENGLSERGPSQGNWLAGTNYPVINNDTAAQAYGLQGFPSLYIIVPSGTPGEPGKVYNLDRDNKGAMVAAINTARGNNMIGVDSWARVTASNIRYCEAEGAITAVVESYGHVITSVTAELRKAGAVIDTKNFTLNLTGFKADVLSFTGIALENGPDYEVVLTQVNGAAPVATEPEFNITEKFKLFPSASVESGKNIIATLHTDSYPSEIQFGIYNSAGEYVYVSPVLTNTAANKNTTLTYNINLDPIDCYGITLVDGYGDGWVDGTGGPYGLTLKSGGTVLFSTDGEFIGRFDQDATFKTNGQLGNESFETSSLAVYPNPSNGVFNFNTEETINVTVVDLTGKTVHTAKNIENGGSIDLSGLQKGMYIAKINGASGQRNEKLIIK